MTCLPRGAAQIGPERRSDKVAAITAVVLFVFMGSCWFVFSGFRPHVVFAFRASMTGYVEFHTAGLENP